MPRSPEEQNLRDRFFQMLMHTAMSWQQGPDPEMALEALLEAVQLLQNHLQDELTELRTERAE